MTRLELWTVDTEKRLLIHPQQGGRDVGLSRGSWLWGRDKAGNSELILQKIPAGTYSLVSANWGGAHGELGEASPVAPRSIASTVKPDAATYVDSYAFDRPWTIFGKSDWSRRRAMPPPPARSSRSTPIWVVDFVDHQAVLMSLACKVDMGGDPHPSCLAAP